MKLLGMEICLCRTVFPIIASQRAFPLSFKSVFCSLCIQGSEIQCIKACTMYTQDILSKDMEISPQRTLFSKNLSGYP